jgi:hypothetical protein
MVNWEGDWLGLVLIALPCENPNPVEFIAIELSSLFDLFRLYVRSKLHDICKLLKFICRRSSSHEHLDANKEAVN